MAVLELIEEAPSLPRTFLGPLQTVSLIYCAQLRIGAFNLNDRRDFDLWLTLVEFDCASYPDDFPLEYRNPLVGRDS
jgi:hypothetical protein